MIDIEKILIERGAILKGHFLLTSGLHSDTYFEKFRILEDPKLTEMLISTVIDRLRELHPDVVVGPTIGGVAVAFEVARQLGTKAYYAERDENGGRVLRRGFRLTPDNRVLVVDDVLTTGKSLLETFEAVKPFGSKIVGAFVFIDRSENFDPGVPLISLLKVRVKNYRPEECPMCRAGLPLVKRGSSRGINPQVESHR